MKKTKWSKRHEKLYEDLCIDNYDEEACYNFVLLHDDSDFDYGEEVRHQNNYL